MKKILFTLLLAFMVVLFLHPGRGVLSKFLGMKQPKLHQVQRSEWLSKIALRYYGDSSYWRELALLNRAPDHRLLRHGEEVIVPSFRIIQEIRRTKKFFNVAHLINEVVEGEPQSSPDQKYQWIGDSKSMASYNSEVQLPEIYFDNEFRIVERKSRVPVAIIILVSLAGLGMIAVPVFYYRSRQCVDTSLTENADERFCLNEFSEAKSTERKAVELV
jgi:hypothetical protein